MTDTEKVSHPIFARIYERVGPAAERAGAAGHRTRLLAGLSGRVVEPGAGNGLNFRHYPATVTEVIAVEPEAYLRQRAVTAASAVPVKVTVLDGTAARLPLADASVDAAVVSLMLCSVTDQSVALAEVFRVTRPGGELRFYEHVLAPRGSRLNALQRALDPLWTRMAGGCHLTRDTESAIAAAGFAVEECERFVFAPCLTSRLAGTHILGRARRP